MGMDTSEFNFTILQLEHSLSFHTLMEKGVFTNQLESLKDKINMDFTS